MNILKRIVRKILQLGKKVIVQILSFFPIRNIIIVESFLGNKNDDNISLLLKSMPEELLTEYQLYYVQKRNNHTDIPCGKRLIKNTVEYYWIMNTAALIITNSRLHTSHKRKRENQKIIQVWHGTPWKKLVYDQEAINFGKQSSEEYLVKFSEDVEKWDYLLVPNEYTKEKLTSAFRYKGKYLEYMYPADVEVIQKGSNIEYKNNVKMGLSIPLDMKIALYMPTFREELQIKAGSYEDFETFDVEAFVRAHPDYIIITRAHYLVNRKDRAIDNDVSERIIDVSTYDSVSDLYLIADVLITDYSSALYSFAFLERPIVAIHYDYEEYVAMRDLYEDGIDDMGISIVRTPAELLNLDFYHLPKAHPKESAQNMNYESIIELIMENKI